MGQEIRGAGKKRGRGGEVQGIQVKGTKSTALNRLVKSLGQQHHYHQGHQGDYKLIRRPPLLLLHWQHPLGFYCGIQSENHTDSHKNSLNDL